MIGALLVLPACIPGPDKTRVAKRPNATPTTAEMRACVSDLNQLSARYTILPDQNYGSGCSANNAVQLLAAGVPVTNVTAIRCSMARTMTLWVQGSVQSAARSAFGKRVERIETMGAYSCRNIVGGRGGRRSEHASANAVDVSAFILAGGQRVSIKSGWNGTDDERQFLRDVRAGACDRFKTVLSPDFNAAHHDHLHFDLAANARGNVYCR